MVKSKVGVVYEKMQADAHGGDLFLMDKYRELVEFLKSDYLGQRGRWGETEDPVSPPESFQISAIPYDESIGIPVKIYEIKSKEDDKAWKIMISPASFLYSSNMEKRRAKLISEHAIKGIFTLKNAFFRYSTIPTSVIIFGASEEDIWLTTAMETDDVLVLMKDIRSYERKVYFTSKLDPKNFMPEFYNGEMNEVNIQLDKYETKELQDIAEIINGKNARPELLSDTGIPYLRGRNIQGGKIVDVDTFVIPDAVEEFSKVLLEEGDILLQKQFGYHKIARVEATDLPAIASSGLFIIRAFDVPENYLFTYLTSETGKAIFDKQLKSIERGATIVSIGLADLKKVKVPLFDAATMDSFANIETAKIQDITSRNNRLMTYYAAFNEAKADTEDKTESEKKVIESFSETGWSAEDVKTHSVVVQLAGPRSWEADIALMNGEELLAIVEVRSSIYLTNRVWLDNMKAIIESKAAPFLILSNGSYYEIHSTKDGAVHKMMSPPTKEVLLSILNGKEVK